MHLYVIVVVFFFKKIENHSHVIFPNENVDKIKLKI